MGQDIYQCSYFPGFTANSPADLKKRNHFSDRQHIAWSDLVQSAIRRQPPLGKTNSRPRIAFRLSCHRRRERMRFAIRSTVDQKDLCNSIRSIWQLGLEQESTKFFSFFHSWDKHYTNQWGLFRNRRCLRWWWIHCKTRLEWRSHF